MKKLLTFLSAFATALVLPLAAYAQAVPPPITPKPTGDLQSIFPTVITWVAGIAGMIAVAYLIYGGISYIIGGASGADNAKKIIINAIIGVIIILLAYVILNTILGLFV